MFVSNFRKNLFKHQLKTKNKISIYIVESRPPGILQRHECRVAKRVGQEAVDDRLCGQRQRRQQVH
jgi:hypothetical protein